jgi:hypothetical protein
MRTLFLLLLVAANLRAQNVTTVAFPNVPGPRKLVVENLFGSVTVRGYSGQDAIVESVGGNGGGRVLRGRKEPPPGMHRIAGEGEVEIRSGRTLHVEPSPIGGPVNLVIQVPTETDVKVETASGREIVIEGIAGEVEAESLNGSVRIQDVSGSVVASTLNGQLNVTLNRVDPAKALSFSTMNGVIHVTLPSAIKANVRMKTANGEIFTDFDVQMRGTTRSRDNTLNGTINGGGPEIRFESFNGDIFIHKR